MRHLSRYVLGTGPSQGSNRGAETAISGPTNARLGSNRAFCIFGPQFILVVWLAYLLRWWGVAFGGY